MKIDETKGVSAVAAQAAKSEPKTAPAHAAPVERITNRATQQVANLVSSVKSTEPATRSARVAELAAAVKSGRYHVNSQQLAERIVQEAELEARLRAMLTE